MITFLPYPDIFKCAECLDNLRLNKQLIEGAELINYLRNGGDGAVNRYLVDMWEGNEQLLFDYLGAIFTELVGERGYTDEHKSWQKILACCELSWCNGSSVYKYPYWWGWKELHDSHKAQLYHKNPPHYGKYFGENLEKIPYFWPTKGLTK